MAASCSPASSPIPAATPAAGTPARSAERAILIPRTAARAPAPAMTAAPPARSAEPAAAIILRTPARRAAAAAAGAGAAPARPAQSAAHPRAVAAPVTPVAAIPAAAAAAAITPRHDNRRPRAPYIPSRTRRSRTVFVRLFVLRNARFHGILIPIRMGDDTMGNFFCRLFAPWKAESCFDDPDDFYDFLLHRNRALNAVRVLFFAAAAVCLMLGYAFEPQPYKVAVLPCRRAGVLA